jgi:hypothetical protein
VGCEKPTSVSTSNEQIDNTKDNATTTSANLIYGKWQLMKVEGGFSNTQYYNGEIIWDINHDQIAVAITNNIYYPILPFDSLGFYSYIINKDTLTLINKDNGMTEGYQYIVTPTTLTIDGNLSACGKKFQFTKIH